MLSFSSISLRVVAYRQVLVAIYPLLRFLLLWSFQGVFHYECPLVGGCLYLKLD